MREPVVRVCRVGDVQLGSGFLRGVEGSRWPRLVHAEDRRSYLAAHILVRQVAAEFLGRPAPEAHRLVLEQSCPTCGGVDHGRPSIAGHPGVRVSLSHARGVVAAIAAGSPCGIDVETVAAGGVPDEALTPREQSWLATRPDAGAAAIGLWVRKEAWAKAHGEGVAWAFGTDVLAPDWLTGELQTEEYAAAWVVL